MRYSLEQKQETHARILLEAAKAIGTFGPERIGVASVMNEAGLTHGGFYAHFASKDELISQTVAFMFSRAVAKWEGQAKGLSATDALTVIIDSYLTITSRDQRGSGCPMAGLASDLPRLPAQARIEFAEGTRQMIGAIAVHLNTMKYEGATAIARSVVSELVGTLALARCIGDGKESAEILRGGRRQLKLRLGLPL